MVLMQWNTGLPDIGQKSFSHAWSLMFLFHFFVVLYICVILCTCTSVAIFSAFLSQFYLNLLDFKVEHADLHGYHYGGTFVVLILIMSLILFKAIYHNGLMIKFWYLIWIIYHGFMSIYCTVNQMVNICSWSWLLSDPKIW